MVAMSEVTAASPRRSTRAFHKMRIQAQGRGHNGKKFRETCETVVVNGFGGLLLLKHEVNNGEMLVITNPETQEELECRIVYLGDLGAKGQRVGIEFLTPAPRFWGVDFSIEPHAIAFKRGDDNTEHAEMDFIIRAFDSKGKSAGNETQNLKADFKPETFAQIMTIGLRFRETIKLPPGKYLLEMGVRDARSNLMGTVSALVEVPQS